MGVLNVSKRVVQSESVRSRAVDVVIANMVTWTFMGVLMQSVDKPAFVSKNLALQFTLFTTACSQPGLSGCSLANTAWLVADRAQKDHSETYKIFLLGSGFWLLIRGIINALRWAPSS